MSLIGKKSFVASTYRSRGTPCSASPMTFSALPRPYTLAVSNSVMPRSRARCTHAIAFFRLAPLENVNQEPNAISETMSSLAPSLR